MPPPSMVTVVQRKTTPAGYSVTHAALRTIKKTHLTVLQFRIPQVM